MSTGSFLTGVAAAVALSFSAASAAPSDDHPSKQNQKHEVASSSYKASFPTGALCSALGGTARASSETLHGNPFTAFGHASAYSSFFFNSSGTGGFGVGVANHGSASNMPASFASSASTKPQVTMPGNAPFATTPAMVGGKASPATGPAATSVGPIVSGNSLNAVALSTPSATPEPATLLLLSTGAVGLLLSRRRRNRE